MPLIKFVLVLFATIVTLLATAQESSKFSVILKGWHRDSIQLPKVFDTVFLNLTFEQTTKIYTKITTPDSTFILSDVPIGKYWLVFSTQSYCVSPLPILVCTKCDNQFYFFASLKEQAPPCNIFEMVEVELTYAGGDKALSKDFQRHLGKNEKRQLKSIPDFKVHFFVTKQKAISDISFAPSDLSQELKNTISKGLATVTNWRPAIQNGRIVDAEYSLDKKTLFK
jgi:hypothetical protein